MTKPDTAELTEGLAADLRHVATRRMVLGLGMAAFGGRVLAGPACLVPAEETAGPFPADGSNRRNLRLINVLNQVDVVRGDLRPSFAGLTGTAEGLAVQLEINLVDAGRDCTPLAGHAIYLWHCDRDGRYSLYDLPEVNYLRGLAVSDASGLVRVKTVFPGCYPGRWPHIHFEVFRSAEAAMAGEAALLTSQFALPQGVCASVYGTEAGYAASKAYLAALSLEGDMVFGDNSESEMAAVMLVVKRDPMAGTTARAVLGLVV